MIVATDVDGVLSHPMGLRCFDWVLRRRELCHRLMDFPVIGKFLYRMRQVNKEMKAFLVELHKAGHTIIVISFMPIRHIKEVTRWLELNQIPFDALHLPFDGEEEIAFRIRAIPDNCEIYFDDDKKNVEKLSSLLVKTKVIRHQGTVLALSELW